MVSMVDGAQVVQQVLLFGSTNTMVLNRDLHDEGAPPFIAQTQSLKTTTSANGDPTVLRVASMSYNKFFFWKYQEYGAEQRFAQGRGNYYPTTGI